MWNLSKTMSACGARALTALTVGPPHVAADRFQPLRTVLSEEVEEPLKRPPWCARRRPTPTGSSSGRRRPSCRHGPASGRSRPRRCASARRVPGVPGRRPLPPSRPACTVDHEQPNIRATCDQGRSFAHSSIVTDIARVNRCFPSAQFGTASTSQPASLAAHSAKGVDQREPEYPTAAHAGSAAHAARPGTSPSPRTPRNGAFVPTVRNDPHNDLVQSRHRLGPLETPAGPASP